MDSQNKLKYGVCRTSVACLWKNANHEMRLVSQVLFGEIVELITIKNKRWVRVMCTWDNTVGWMHPGQLHYITETTFHKLKDEQHLNLELLYGLISSQVTIPITIGARLHNFDGISVRMPFGKFQYSGQVYSQENSSFNEALFLKIANKFIHAPYMPGGRNILGIDQGSFVQLIYMFAGINLPRYPEEQANVGEDVGFVQEARIGDLAIFTDKNNQIKHVGLVYGPKSIIHVHGKVKIDKLDQQGIFDLEIRRYTYRLRTIRRVLNI